MPLNLTPKTNPNNPTAQPAARDKVQINPPTSSARLAQQLKQRLTSAPPQTVAPRPVGSTLRAEQQAKQVKYTSPTPVPAPPPPTAPAQQKFADVEPPPSGDPNVRAAQAAAGSSPASTAAPAPATAEQPAAAPGAQPVTGTGTPVTAQPEATKAAGEDQFAAIARRERQVRRAQQEVQAEKATLQQERANFISRADLADPSKTLRLLAEAGITADRLVELQVNQAHTPDPEPAAPSDPATHALHTKIAELEARLAKVDDTFKERDELQRNQAREVMLRDAKLLADSDPAFETIKATDSSALVVELIEREFDATGEIMDVDVAARLIEEKLVEQEWQRFQRLQNLTKIKSKLAPPAPEAPSVTAEEEVAATPQPQQPAPSAATLTNAGSRQPALSPRDRVIARLKGQL